MSWQVVTTRTAATLQPIIDDAPAVFQYCTDGFSTYETLNYHQGLHLVADGKSQTYSVDGGNADLRDYLTRGAKCPAASRAVSSRFAGRSHCSWIVGIGGNSTSTVICLQPTADCLRVYARLATPLLLWTTQYGNCYTTAQSTIARAPLRSSLILQCKVCSSFSPLTCFHVIPDNGIFNRCIHRPSVVT